MTIATVRGRLLVVLAALSFVGVAGMTALYVGSASLVDDLASSSRHVLALSSAFDDLSQSLSDQETGLRGYVLTADVAFLQPYTDAIKTERDAEDQLRTLIATRPDLAAALTAVTDAADAWRSTYAEPAISEIRGGSTASARSVDELRRGKALFDSVRSTTDQLSADIGTPDADLAANQATMSAIRTVLFGAGLAVFLVTLVLVWRALGRWVSGPVGQLRVVARRVEAGENVPFPARTRDEIGDLGAALERMRLRLRDEQSSTVVAAGQADIVNRFNEVSAFSEGESAVADAALVAMRELVAPDGGSLHVANRSGDRATVAATIGDAEASDLALHRLETCPGIRRGGVYVSPDLAMPLAVCCPIAGRESGTVACLPLIALGDVIGVAHLWWNRRDALSLVARGPIERITEHAAFSIGNRRLLTALQGMASTDARTGLSNSRSWDDQVGRILDAAPPEATHGVLMLDLDRFKDFNDRFGHAAGDEALKTFASILTSSVRTGDHVARYGGEEFAVLLVDADTSVAQAVAERIRARTEATIVKIGPGNTARIAVSIGVAMRPIDGTDRIGLLHAADAALYRAKNAGRNRVVLASDAVDESDGDGGPAARVVAGASRRSARARSVAGSKAS